MKRAARELALNGICKCMYSLTLNNSSWVLSGGGHPAGAKASQVFISASVLKMEQTTTIDEIY